MRTQAPQQLHANDSAVRIDRGFDQYAYGTVCRFDRDERVHGNRGYYYIRITGGLTVFGKPATIGEVIRVFHGNVQPA